MGTKVYTLPGLTSYSGALNFDEGEQADRPPSGPASGDLASNFPAPSVVALHANGTQLALGAVPDGAALVRHGTTISGDILGLAGDVIGSLDNAQVKRIHMGVQPLDIGTINDGQFLQRSGTSVVGVAATTTGAGNVYLSPPASPNALDDEFKSGSSVLSARGFSCVNATTGATMTRVGEVLQAAPGLAANEYRSTLNASGMLIQAGSEMVVYKNVSGSLAVYCHASVPLVPGTSTAFFYEAPALFGVAPLVVSNTVRRVFMNNYGNARAFSKMDLNQAYTTLGSIGTGDGPWGAWISWDDAAKQAWGIALNPQYERWDLDVPGQSFPAFTPVAAGLVVMTPNNVNTWVVLRTFRVYPVGKLPGIA